MLKKKVGEFLYDLTWNINLIQREKLASSDNVNHLKMYIIHNATLTTIAAEKIPIFDKENEFNVINLINFFF